MEGSLHFSSPILHITFCQNRPSYTVGKCALMHAVKQPEHGRVLTTEDWNILLTEKLWSSLIL